MIGGLRPTLRGLVLAGGLALALAGPAAAQKTFIPTTFYGTYSFANPPALRIKPGETIATKTLESSGEDWNGKSRGKNAVVLTGPFYVEGAEPGDQLVITLDKVDINRDTAHSGSLLAPYTTEPADLLARADRMPKQATWLLDKDRRVARLKDTDLEPQGIELPLRPMIGIIGVAPANKEAIWAPSEGRFGGNMDYVGAETGAKIILPVFEPGALLLMGDGHARMGDGEVVGTGMETSLDVTFTVALVKNKPIAWPRAESKDEIIVLASSRALLEAFQGATAELHRWLMADYGMTDRGAALLMGQAAKYEIAQVVDTNFTIAAKMPKQFLPKR
jgi:amidase